MSLEAVARSALLDRDVRINQQDPENYVAHKISLTTEQFCSRFVIELYNARKGPKGLKGIEEMARDIVEKPGWVSRMTPHLEPVGENGLVGIRLKDPSCLKILKSCMGSKILDDTCNGEDCGGNEGVFEAVTTKEGVAYLLVLASTTSNGKAHLSWNEDFNRESFRRFPEFQGLCRNDHEQPFKSNKFKVMEDWVKLQLGNLANEYIETIEEFQHENGAYVKRQHPQLRFSDGHKNAHAGFLKDSSAKTWAVGSRVKLSDGEWSHTKVLFSCTADGYVSTIPPYSQDTAVRRPQAWAEMLQCSEGEFKECITKALRDAHFCEFAPTDEEREKANQEAYLDPLRFNESLRSRLGLTDSQSRLDHTIYMEETATAETSQQESAESIAYGPDTDSESDFADSAWQGNPTHPAPQAPWLACSTTGEFGEYPSQQFLPASQAPWLNSQSVLTQPLSLSLAQTTGSVPLDFGATSSGQPQTSSNESQARAMPRRQRRNGKSVSDGTHSHWLGIINRAATFECKDKMTRKGQLGEKGCGLFEIVKRHGPINSRDEQSLFRWLLDEDVQYESPKVVKYAKQQGWHELIQKAIAIASEDRLKQIAQKFKGSVRGVSGDAHGTLVMQQLLEAALTQARENAERSQGNEPRGLARTIFSIFKSYLVDERGVIQSSRPLDSSDRQLVQYAIFVVEKYLLLQAWLPEEAEAHQQVLEILGDNPATACSQTGCRVYQRILETPESKVRADVVQCFRGFVMKLLAPKTFHDLIKDQYGNFVIQHILKVHRPIDEKLHVLSLVGRSLHNYAIDNWARHVVQRCFENDVTVSFEPAEAMAWREAQKHILDHVFTRDGKLRSTYKVLQDAAAARHVLEKMRSAFQAVSQLQ